jgi:hypothetical protein
MVEIGLFGKPCVIYVKTDATTPSNSMLYVAYAFCEGEITSFDAIFIDGTNIIDPVNGIQIKFKNFVINYHTGSSTQTADSILSSKISGYTDTFRNSANKGTAYVVCGFPLGSTDGFPSCEAIIKGHKVYDPRKDSTSGVGSGAHRLNTPSTWEYSSNPALCFAHFQYVYVGFSMDWTSVATVADTDELHDSNGNVLRDMGLTLATPQLTENWVAAFRAYMGAYVVPEQGLIKLIPDQPSVRKNYALTMNIGKTSGHYQYVVFDDPGAFVNFGTSLSASDFTLETFIKPSATISATGVLMGRYNTSTQAHYLFEVIATNQLQLEIRDVNGVTVTVQSGACLTPGVFQQVAVVVELVNRLATFYVDGVQVGSSHSLSALTGGFALVNSPYFIGGLGTSLNPFIGTIDEARWWARKQSTTDMAQFMLREAGPGDTGLVCVFSLNEGTGVDVFDYSGNGMDGTYVTGTGITPTWVDGDQRLIPFGAIVITPNMFKGVGVQLTQLDVRNFPTSVIVEYVDNGDNNSWQIARVFEEAPGVSTGVVPRRISRISLPGIHDPSIAHREAYKRLLSYLSLIRMTLTGWGEFFGCQVGSIVAITRGKMKNKLFRVVGLSQGDAGSWSMNLEEFNQLMYSTAAIVPNTVQLPSIGNPTDPIIITGGTVVTQGAGSGTGSTIVDSGSDIWASTVLYLVRWDNGRPRDVAIHASGIETTVYQPSDVGDNGGGGITIPISAGAARFALPSMAIDATTSNDPASYLPAFIDVDPLAVFSLNNGHTVIELWFKWDTGGFIGSSDVGIMGNSQVSSFGRAGSWAVFTSGGKLKFSVGNGTSYDSITGGGTLSLNTWHHVALIYSPPLQNTEFDTAGVSHSSGSNHRYWLFLDGVSQGTPINSSTSHALDWGGTPDFVIGQQPGFGVSLGKVWQSIDAAAPWVLNGEIHDFRISQQAFTSTQLTGNDLNGRYMVWDGSSKAIPSVTVPTADFPVPSSKTVSTYVTSANAGQVVQTVDMKVTGTWYFVQNQKMNVTDFKMQYYDDNKVLIAEVQAEGDAANSKDYMEVFSYAANATGIIYKWSTWTNSARSTGHDSVQFLKNGIQINSATSGSAVWDDVVTKRQPLTIQTKTADYTAVTADAGVLTRMNSSSPLNYNVPNNSSVAFDIGTVLAVSGVGTGTVTIVAASGVTINSPATLVLRTQGSPVAIVKTATNTWDLYGDVS